MNKTEVDQLILALVNAVITAIAPAMIRPSWIESHIRPIIEQALLKGDTR